MLREDDEERELDFEIDYLLSLTFEQRMTMMLEESDRIASTLIENGQREPAAVVKRPCR
jgi:hypothetical protein